MSLDRVERATQRGLAFIRSTQAADGSFGSLSSPTLTPFTPEREYQTTFTPAIILSAISKLTHSDASEVRKKLAEWLLAQKSPQWSFNYWAVMAPERASLPYPDDLDDTSCALIALHQQDASVLDEACLGKVVRLLVACESKVGGPYRTWLVAKDAPAVWQDVDLAVNSNINYLLSLVAEPLPNLTALIEEAIDTRQFTSPYYPSAFPIIYYIARSYRGKYRSMLADCLLERQKDGWWGSPLETALAVSALAHLGQGASCKTAIEVLLKHQQPDGSWPAEAFCLDPAIKGRTYYSGSPALTTALVLEAIHACQQVQAGPLADTPARIVNTPHRPLQERIAAAAAHICDQQSPELRQQSRAVLQETLARDHANNDEIVLLPLLFNQSLAKPLDAAKTDIFLHFGLANLLGWMAYTIYDDFLDNEGDVQLLSVANMSLRHSLDQFRAALPQQSDYQEQVQRTFDIIDGANAWELAHCRMPTSPRKITITKLPRYRNTISLADRSLGHTLTPLGILAASGIAPDDKRTINIKQALRHYIAARQLNDDLHDWEQDLRAGRISYVVASIMAEMDLRPGSYTFSRLVPKMQHHFWHQTLPNICRTIALHSKQARYAANASQLLTTDNVITKVTKAIDKSVAHTLDEQAKAEKFLAAYQS